MPVTVTLFMFQLSPVAKMSGWPEVNWMLNSSSRLSTMPTGNGMVTVLVDPPGHCAPLFRFPPATS